LWSPVTNLSIGPPRVTPGEEGRHRANVDIPPGYFCGVDSLPLSPVLGPIGLTPGGPRRLRCATALDAPITVDLNIPAEQTGPLLHQVRIGDDSSSTGNGIRVINLSLSDAMGLPISYANVRVAGEGVQAEAFREEARRGFYTALARLPPESQGLRLVFTVNDSVTFDYTIGSNR